MARLLNSLTISAPASDPTPNVGGSFTFTAQPGFSGSGGVTAYDLYFQWDQGTGTWATIPASGGLSTSGTNPQTGLTTTGTTSITVSANTGGAYNIRVLNISRGITSASLAVTVSDPNPIAVPTAGVLRVAGQEPTVSVSDNAKVAAPSAGLLRFAGNAPSTTPVDTAYPAWFARLQSGYNAWAYYATTEGVDKTVRPAVATVRLVGQQPTVQRSGFIAPTAGLLQFVGQAPSVVNSGSRPAWFARLTAGANSWASLAEDTTVATLDGVGELPPFALLGQATFTFTASASLTVKKPLTGSAGVSFTASASLRVVTPVTPTPAYDIYLRDESNVILYTEAGVSVGNEILIEDLPLPPEVDRLPEDIIPASADWRLVTSGVMFVSPLNGKTQTVSRGGERWACTLTYRNLQRADAAVITAYLASLRGQAGRAVLPDHAYVRRGNLTTNLFVYFANQSGTSLACGGGTPSVTDAVRAGDMVTLENRLYMIAEDADTDTNGHITLSLIPPLETAPAVTAAVNILAPTARFMLAGNTVSWSHSPGGFTTAQSVEFIENRI